MDAKEAKKALELQDGLQIDGRPIKVAKFIEALDFADKVLDMQIKMQEFCNAEDACGDCPYCNDDEWNNKCMNDFVVFTN